MKTRIVFIVMIFLAVPVYWVTAALYKALKYQTKQQADSLQNYHHLIPIRPPPLDLQPRGRCESESHRVFLHSLDNLNRPPKLSSSLSFSKNPANRNPLAGISPNVPVSNIAKQYKK